MKWIALVARLAVGVPFLVFGLNHFLKFIPMEPPELKPAAKSFMDAIWATGYLDVVKVLEIVGGFLVLTGRFAPLGLVVATPVAVNIMLWDLCLMQKPALGVALTVLCFGLVVYYRRHFAGAFQPAPVV
jgi:putative oxidoreductase